MSDECWGCCFWLALAMWISYMYNEHFKPNQIPSFDYIIGTTYSLDASQTKDLPETKFMYPKNNPPPPKKRRKKINF